MAKIYDSTEFAKWKSFRQSEDSRYVGLCVPHILMRLPYGKDTKPVDGFNYEEGVDGTITRSTCGATRLTRWVRG